MPPCLHEIGHSSLHFGVGTFLMYLILFMARRSSSHVDVLQMQARFLHLHAPRLPACIPPSYGPASRFHVGACASVLSTIGGTVMVSSLCLHRGARIVDR